MTQLGIGTYAYAWAIGVPGYPPEHPMTAGDFLRRAAELGVSLVQIADNLPLAGLPESDLAALQAGAQRLNMAVEIGARGIQPENLRAHLALAHRFGSPILRAVVDAAGFEPEPAEIVAILRDFMPAFAAAGVVLAIENHDRFKARTLADIIRAVREGDDAAPIGICLDTVNSFGSLEGPEAVVATLGPYVVNLHVKDFWIRRHDHNMGFTLTGTPAGQGQLDLPWLLAQLRGCGRSFNAILELWPPPEPTVAATVAKEDAWVVESVAYLKRAISY